MKLKSISLILFGVLFVGLAVVAFAQTPEPAAAPPANLEIPFLQVWTASPHADAKAEAFIHWNETDDKAVPVACAKCHSTTGYAEYISTGAIKNPVPVGTVITCVACHNEAAIALDTVLMPSGVKIGGLGPEARCMECHQGRASAATVDDSIKKANVTDVDTVSKDLGFTNIHYFAAAATLYGRVAQGGYQYAGKAYDAKFDHVQGFSTCVGCHDQHSLKLRLEKCAGCHTAAKSTDDLKNIRMQGSEADYNGNGSNITEGIYSEVDGLRTLLYKAMQAYGAKVAKTAIAYDPVTYPYFFVDTNGNGQVDSDEAKADNGYKSWTARLAKAAYNYQTSIKDPGAFTHNGKYIIQLLYDSTEDLNQALGDQAVDLSKAHRDDAGHFNASAEAFRHWDAAGMVDAACVRCHTGVGLPMYLKNGVTVAVPPSRALLCSTCHASLQDYKRPEIKDVTFPSGAVLTLDALDPNLCLECHQGRESTVSMNKLLTGQEDDTASDKLRFLNVHYFAAGATLFGTQARGAYEYDGQKYNGRFKHVEPADTCVECHDVHALTVKVELCGGCHPGAKTVDDLSNVKMVAIDYLGSGNPQEGLAKTVDALNAKLYAAMQDYAKTVTNKPIVYSAATYPYFFNDLNGNGQPDPEETDAKNGYQSWAPRLLRAAYNYQYVTKDPGAFAHNGRYIVQILYDSLQNLGQKVKVDMTGMVRPEVAP